MKHIINEFKEFIMRGNVLDLAVGVIIGGAFQKIIASRGTLRKEGAPSGFSILIKYCCVNAV